MLLPSLTAEVIPPRLLLSSRNSTNTHSWLTQAGSPFPPIPRGPPRSCGTHRDYVCDASVKVALVILDSDGSVFLDPLHGEWAVQLRRTGMGLGHHQASRRPGYHPHIPPHLPCRMEGRFGSLTLNFRQNSSMELISEPWTCRKAALYWTRSLEHAAVYLGRGAVAAGD